jgi:dihydroorotase-like cyclic amidohydrolase
LELLMSVARTGLPHHDRTTTAQDRSGDRTGTAADRSSLAVVAAEDDSLAARPQLPAPDRSAAAGNGSAPPRDSRTRVRELVAHERATGTRLHARQVAAAVGISQRRAYELLHDARAEEPAP